jgi:hypothetical protein
MPLRSAARSVPACVYTTSTGAPLKTPSVSGRARRSPPYLPHVPTQQWRYGHNSLSSGTLDTSVVRGTRRSRVDTRQSPCL